MTRTKKIGTGGNTDGALPQIPIINIEREEASVYAFLHFAQGTEYRYLNVAKYLLAARVEQMSIGRNWCVYPGLDRCTVKIELVNERDMQDADKTMRDAIRSFGWA